MARVVLKAGVFSTTAAILATVFAFNSGILDAPHNPYTTNVYEKDGVVKLGTQFDETSVRLAIKGLNRALKYNERVVININSPGGEVFKGRDLLAAVRQADGAVDTYADNSFMSMGMALFLEGKNRYIKADVLGMIHRGSSGHISYGEMKDRLANEPVGSKAAQSLIQRLEIMDRLFDREFEKLREIKETAPVPSLTQAIIDAMMDGRKDVFLTATQLIESGIATELLPHKVKVESLVDRR